MTPVQETKTKPRKTKTRKGRRYFGHVPDGKYEVLGFQNPDWMLFGQEPHPSGWQNLKLVRRGAHSRRSNFWLGWSAVEHRFARCTDQPWLERNEPELLAELIGYLDRTSEAPPRGAK